MIWLDLVASLPLIKERILVIILLLHFLSLMLGSVLVLMLPLLVWLTPDLRIKKSLLKCNWTIRKRLPRCKMSFFFSSRRRHTRSLRDWSSDVCSSDLHSSPFLRSPVPDLLRGQAAAEGEPVPAQVLGDPLGYLEVGHAGRAVEPDRRDLEIGRASCRERVLMRVGDGTSTRNNKCGFSY